jgi:hypothetical protein
MLTLGLFLISPRGSDELYDMKIHAPGFALMALAASTFQSSLIPELIDNTFDCLSSGLNLS